MEPKSCNVQQFGHAKNKHKINLSALRHDYDTTRN